MEDRNILNLKKQISLFIPKERIFDDELTLFAYGADASFYRMVPKLAVQVENEIEIQKILAIANKNQVSVTFRAAGTSLSGQSVTDSVLIMINRGWKKIKISEDKKKITLQPGVIGSHANRALAKYNLKIGPDPASIDAAMIGGIAANNASGMCCGVAQNSYNTLASMRIIFSDGTLLDTADSESVKQFKETHKIFIDEIKKLSKETKSNERLRKLIEKKYKLKNTTGFSLNALIDFEDEIEIIQHLMIGSEGCLGFISEITYYTVPDLPYKASALMLFPDARTACEAIPILKKENVSAAELMDRAALRSVENKEGIPSYIKSLNDSAAALLVETRAENDEILSNNINSIIKALSHLPKEREIEFTRIPEEYAKLWKIRKGLFPSVGAMRKTGTTCIIEDVAYPIDKLADATIELQNLFKKYKYDDAIIFGHSFEGNLHFVFNQDFNCPEEVEKYDRFMQEVSELTAIKYEGSLKGEHGSGRNMAPFVELEWGSEAYQLMKKIKELFDPNNILNPGVVINEDKKIHLKNLKPLPKANLIIDKCIECGFCEVNCPSKDLTLTPRQRITVYREIKRLEQNGIQSSYYNKLKKSYNYYGNQTCATDGLCSLSCPVEIDTGKLIKELRFYENSKFAKSLANIIGKNMSLTINVMRMGLNVVYYSRKLVGDKTVETIAKILRMVSLKKIPSYNKYLPKGAPKIKNPLKLESDLTVVYFPSCINRAMGVSIDYSENEALVEKVLNILQKAKINVVFPEDKEKLCCGMAFNSKGFVEIGDYKAKELEEALLKASNNGEYPILCDMSPCLYRMKETLKKKLRLYDPIKFSLEFLVDRLEFQKLPITIALHNVCSSTKMGLNEDFKKLASFCVEKVCVPENVGCCGWAGDRGFTYPELNQSALKHLTKEAISGAIAGYSTSRTCEIGLTLKTDLSYKSIFYLIDQATKPKATRN